MSQVSFETPGKMNLLGYFLRSLIERNLSSPAGARAFSKLKGTIAVGASEMLVTLKFTGTGLIISLGKTDSVDATVQGSLDSLLSVTLGRELLRPVLNGKLKVSGKIWRLLPLLSFFRAEQKP